MQWGSWKYQVEIMQGQLDFTARGRAGAREANSLGGKLQDERDSDLSNLHRLFAEERLA